MITMQNKQSNTSTTVSQSQGNYRKSWKKKPKTDPEAEKARKRDRAFIKRFNEVGYTQSDNGNFPCFCGDVEDNCVWWMSNTKHRGSHLFCLRCTKRVLEHEIKDRLAELFKVRKEKHSSGGEVSISKLLSKGNDA